MALKRAEGRYRRGIDKENMEILLRGPFNGALGYIPIFILSLPFLSLFSACIFMRKLGTDANGSNTTRKTGATVSVPHGGNAQPSRISTDTYPPLQHPGRLRLQSVTINKKGNSSKAVRREASISECSKPPPKSART